MSQSQDAAPGTNAQPAEERQHLTIFDTTMRDGEQSPGASMNVEEKIRIAEVLEAMGVDVIEAGFPIASDGDFEAVNAIARMVKNSTVCGLARATRADIERCAEAIKPAESGRIHTFISTSPLHMKYKLQMEPEKVYEKVIESVTLARTFTDNVEWSCEDGSRSDRDFLYRCIEAAIASGAGTVNIPDTVGWAVPDEFGELISHLHESVPEFQSGKAIISVHCHNDLGLAVANSLAAVRAGARQVECTVNGIGERAGNAAMEEVVMALKTRKNFYRGFSCGLETKEIVKASKLVARMSGLGVQRSKAIVGENAFAHSSGIHQDGILKKRETYEIMNPKHVGWGKTELPLTKHSGRAAVTVRLKHLGFKMDSEEISSIFDKFKEIGDKKKFVYDDDLAALVEGHITTIPETWALEYLNVSTGNQTVPTATVRLTKKRGRKTQVEEDASIGDGPVDASLKAIDRISKTKGKLMDYSIRAVSQGKDALGEVTLKVDFGNSELVVGKGASTDIIEASARAYLNAVNRYLNNDRKGRKRVSLDNRE